MIGGFNSTPYIALILEIKDLRRYYPQSSGDLKKKDPR